MKEATEEGHEDDDCAARRCRELRIACGRFCAFRTDAGRRHSTNSRGSSRPYDFALGDADRSADAFAARHVAFTAHKSPRATWGKFTSRTAGVTFTSAVMCLRVDGNRAVVGAVIRQSPERSDLDGSRVFVAVEDNGGRFGVTPDRVSAYLFSSPPDTDTCDTATVLYDSLAPVTSGNVSVNANS